VAPTELLRSQLTTLNCSVVTGHIALVRLIGQWTI